MSPDLDAVTTNVIHGLVVEARRERAEAIDLVAERALRLQNARVTLAHRERLLAGLEAAARGLGIAVVEYKPIDEYPASGE